MWQLEQTRDVAPDEERSQHGFLALKPADVGYLNIKLQVDYPLT